MATFNLASKITGKLSFQVFLEFTGSPSDKIERILKETGMQVYHSSEDKFFRSLCTPLMNFRNPKGTAFHVNVVCYTMVKLAQISHYVLKNIRQIARKPQ